jgi:hypothetical protein
MPENLTTAALSRKRAELAGEIEALDARPAPRRPGASRRRDPHLDLIEERHDLADSRHEQRDAFHIDGLS